MPTDGPPNHYLKLEITVSASVDPKDPAVDDAILGIVEKHRCGYGGSCSARVWNGYLGAEQGGFSDGDIAAVVGELATCPLIDRLVIAAADQAGNTAQAP